MTDHDGFAEPLPGLEEPPRPPANLERAVRRTLADLGRRGLLSEATAGKTALAIEMAQVITTKRASGRASTVANDGRLLMELLDSIVPEDSDVDAGLKAAMDEWSGVIEGERAATDPGPEVRDQP